MTAPLWQRDEPDSPCQNICSIHPISKLCIGCHRTLDEISQWPQMSPDARQQLAAKLPARAAAHKQRRGGRAARLAKP